MNKVLERYEPVIGLEIHCQLATDTKIFCGCSTEYGQEPNSQVCPVCLGHPGVLPVLNDRAVELAVAMAFAVGGTVRSVSRFARKNYFYPDLPKGYQISQYDEPYCDGGTVPVDLGEESFAVRLVRIHMEEDAGKLVHGDDAGADGDTLVDLNRCGMPLIEIVTEPDLRSSEQAHAFLSSLRHLVRWVAVSDANMEEGSLRCDANVSIRPRGVETLGTRTEIKNLNSFRHVARAIDFEIERQAGVLDAGKKVIQETRLFDEKSGETRPMRSKEDSHDYRYFPEPDLPLLEISEDRRTEIRAEIPELPWDRARRIEEQYGLGRQDARVLTGSRELANYFEEAVAEYGDDPRRMSNWIQSELLAVLKAKSVEISHFSLSPKDLAGLMALVGDGTISGKIAKQVFAEMVESGESAGDVVERLGLVQIADEATLGPIVDGVIEANPGPVEDLRGGKEKALGFLVGQVMRETRGKANPGEVNRLLRSRLGIG